MRVPKSLRILSGVAVVAALGVVAVLTSEQWMPLVKRKSAEAATAKDASPPVQEPKVLKLSPQARKNLRLVSKPARLQTYWKKVQIPGAIVDRPGRSDRGITSPVVGVVTQIHAFPGDTVKPGDRLFTLRLFSEYLQNTQKELFVATRETHHIEAQLKRLRPLAESGGIAKSKIINLENRKTYEAGESAYLAVLTAQRSYSQARLAWLNAVEQLWSATVLIEGLLLSDILTN